MIILFPSLKFLVQDFFPELQKKKKEPIITPKEIKNGVFLDLPFLRGSEWYAVENHQSRTLLIRS